MSESVKRYVLSAFKLLQVHYRLVLFPLVISWLGSMLYRLSGDNLRILSPLTTLIVLGIMSAIYGRINEIVTKKSFVSWKYLFNKYLLKYLGVIITISLIMCVPYFLFTMLIIHIEAISFSNLIFSLIILVYQLIALYSIPLIFYDNTIKESLSLGFKCLFGNLKYNIPLILIVVLVALLNIPHLQGDNEIFNILFYYIRRGILFVMNFIIFTTITIILDDKIYSAHKL